MRISFVYSNHHFAHISAQPGIAYKLALSAQKSGATVQIISNQAGQVHLRPKGIALVLFYGLGELKTYVLHILKLLYALRSFSPDIIHVHGNLLYVFLSFLSPVIRKPVTVYIGETLDIHDFMLRKLFVHLLKRAKHIFVSSEYIKQQLEVSTLSTERITVVRLGLDRRFLKIKQPHKRSVDVLYYGDATRSRGFDIVVDAAKKLPQYTFTVLLRNLLNDCQEKIEEAKTIANLIIRYYPYEEPLEKILSCSRIILLPFREMGVRPPLTIVESMAVGACVVTSPLEGTEELMINGKNGFILEEIRLTAVISHLKKLLPDRTKTEAVGSQARRDIAQLYGIDEFQKTVKRMIESVKV